MASLDEYREGRIIEAIKSRFGYPEVNVVARGGASGTIFRGVKRDETGRVIEERFFKRTPGISFISTRREQKGSAIKLVLQKSGELTDIIADLHEVDSNFMEKPKGERIKINLITGREIPHIRSFSLIPKDFYVGIPGRDLGLEHWEILSKGYDAMQKGVTNKLTVSQNRLKQLAMKLQSGNLSHNEKEDIERAIKDAEAEFATTFIHSNKLNELEEKARARGLEISNPQHFKKLIIESGINEILDFDVGAKFWRGSSNIKEVTDRIKVGRILLSDTNNIDMVGRATARMLEKSIEDMFLEAAREGKDITRVFRARISEWQKGMSKAVKEEGGKRFERLTRGLYHRDAHLKNLTEASGIFDFDATGKSSLAGEIGRYASSMALLEKNEELNVLQEEYRKNPNKEEVLSKLRNLIPEMKRIGEETAIEALHIYRNGLEKYEKEPVRLFSIQRGIREAQKVIRADSTLLKPLKFLAPKFFEKREERRVGGELPLQKLGKHYFEWKAGRQRRSLERAPKSPTFFKTLRKRKPIEI